MLGETFSLDNTDVSGLDNVFRLGLDDQNTTVEVGDVEAETGQSLGKSEVLLVDKIVTLANELARRIRLLLEDDDNVTGHDSGLLVGLAVEGDLLARPHTLIDVDLEVKLLGGDLLTPASLTLVLLGDGLTATHTLVTSGLHPLHHTGAQLTENHTNTTTATGLTGGLHSGLLGTRTLALATNNVAGGTELGGLSIVELFKGDPQFVHHVLKKEEETLVNKTKKRKEKKRKEKKRKEKKRKEKKRKEKKRKEKKRKEKKRKEKKRKEKKRKEKKRKEKKRKEKKRKEKKRKEKKRKEKKRKEKKRKEKKRKEKKRKEKKRKEKK